MNRDLDKKTGMAFKPLNLIRMPLEGTSLIEASAGTGKTYTIANLYLRLLLEKALDVQQILVVTFTEAATKELRDRIRRNLNAALQEFDRPGGSGDETIARIVTSAAELKSVHTAINKLQRALVCFDEAAIFTIHGFCKRILDENAFESAIMFDMELVTDQRRLVQEITDDFWRRHFAGASYFINALASGHGLRYSRFTALARQLANNPTLAIIPAMMPLSANDMTRRYTELKQAWRESKGEVTAILQSENSGFSKSGHPFYRGQLVDWLIKLDNACSDTPAPDDLTSIAMFTTEHLTGRLKKNFALPAHRFFDLCQAYCNAEKEFVIGIQQRYAAYLKSELSRRKQAANIQFFDDLLVNVHSALKNERDSLLARAIRAKFEAALIDEFQDTDPIQYDIFRILFARENKSLFLIGDPKQSIYGFRGADVFAYIRAAGDLPEQQKYTLNENWRSESQFVDAANCFFSPVENPFVLGDTIVYTPVQAAGQSLGNRFPLTIAHDPPGNLVLWFINRNNSQTTGTYPNKNQARLTAAKAVVYEISRLLAKAGRGEASLGDRPIRPSDCAVLVTRNADAQLIKDHLAKANIPAVTTRAENIFKTSQAREIEQTLAAVAAPGDLTKLRTALATELLGCPAEIILASVEDEPHETEMESHMDRFAAYHALWQTHGFIGMFRKLLQSYDVACRLLRHPQGERNLTNILHLTELIHSAAFENNLGPNGVLNWIKAQRSTEEENEELELRLERDDAAVQILTVFRSKGLQYPIVFCPFMWQAEPASRSANIVFHMDDNLYLDIGTEQRLRTHQDRAVRENLAELVRLLYVALTRAQNRCYLTFGRIGKATALDYILTGGEKPSEDIYTHLISILNNLDEETLHANVRRASQRCSDHIRVTEPVLATPHHYRPPAADRRPALTCRVFERGGSWVNDWMIASFSRLVSEKFGRRTPNPAHRLKADEFATEPTHLQPAPADTFFTFPGGTLTGSCIHTIFETINFSRPESDHNRLIIDRLLKKFGLADAGRSHGDMVHRMITRVLQAPLLKNSPELTLEQIPTERRIPEMEFFYPLKRFTPSSLQDVLSDYTDAPTPGLPDFAEKIGQLDFKPVSGFMRGFIDLVFKFEYRYYLLDWKTNHLGNTFADYDVSHLTRNMVAAYYNLQYYIYTVALHKYLASRVADYTYDTHFGGVFYLYIRGIHPEHPGSGIFFDRPSADLVKALSNLFGL